MVLSRGMIKTGFVFTRYHWLLHGEWKIWAVGQGTVSPTCPGGQHPAEETVHKQDSIPPRGRAACGGRYKAVWEHNTRDSFSLGGIKEGFVEEGDA